MAAYGAELLDQAFTRAAGAALVSGNRVRLLKDGTENYPAWLAAIAAARDRLCFENFIFCRREHLTMLTCSYLEELLTDAGFSTVRRCLPVRETNHPDLFRACLEKEYETDFDNPHTLMVEAEKPGTRT